MEENKNNFQKWNFLWNTQTWYFDFRQFLRRNRMRFSQISSDYFVTGGRA